MKKYLWMSSAAAVICALRVKFDKAVDSVTDKYQIGSNWLKTDDLEQKSKPI